MGGDGRSVTVKQEDGDACTDGCCPPQRMFHIDAGSATAPCFGEDVEETRGDLGVGQSRPPEVPGHTEIWGRGLSAVAVWHGLSEGNDGGVSGHDGPGEQLDAVLVGAAREGEGGCAG